MREEEMDSDDNLRLHYDLAELEVVKLGPGWSKSKSVGLSQGVEDSDLPIVSKLSQPN